MRPNMTAFRGTVRKCETPDDKWCERTPYVCGFACERAVQAKVAEIIDGFGKHMISVGDQLATEQTMHMAWRKRAEEAEAREAAMTQERDEALAALTIAHRDGGKAHEEAQALREDAEGRNPSAWMNCHGTVIMAETKANAPGDCVMFNVPLYANAEAQALRVGVERWRARAEYEYALRQYPDELDLGCGALDAHMRTWTMPKWARKDGNG